MNPMMLNRSIYAISVSEKENYHRISFICKTKTNKQTMNEQRKRRQKVRLLNTEN